MEVCNCFLLFICQATAAQGVIGYAHLPSLAITVGPVQVDIIIATSTSHRGIFHTMYTMSIWWWPPPGSVEYASFNCIYRSANIFCNFSRFWRNSRLTSSSKLSLPDIILCLGGTHIYECKIKSVASIYETRRHQWKAESSFMSYCLWPFAALTRFRYSQHFRFEKTLDIIWKPIWVSYI